MKSVFFHQAAKEELLSVRDYYDDLIFGLGKSFIIEIEKTINIVKNNPLIQSLGKKHIKQ
ncbi:MAG: hypothetical protein IT276_05215 [Ignavibacteriaceae bacterium]|nr:hypothetical protein [Ignavibacterium sp.]MCC6254292.1 hypothetical protein [Ignavibacteriaceae bacterium]HRN27217.1 hypothetical protein [Ignavibacteriaceae bacterium]HRQ54850.1 hypothetical protein [Ignavibacteriaceae bacterium]